MIASPQLASCFTKPTSTTSPRADATIYEIIHLTEYAYNHEIQRSEHWLRLIPTQDQHQNLLAFDLRLEPFAAVQTYVDTNGNEVIHCRIEQPYQRLLIEARSTLAVTAGRDLSRVHVQKPLHWSPIEYSALHPFMRPDALPEDQLRILTDYAQQFLREADGEIIPTIDAINQAIFRDFCYSPGSTVVGTSVFEVFEKRQGVCQDFTNLMLCLLRILRLPSLYRTGYIYTGQACNAHIVPDSSHAWVEVFIPHVGWCGWDPTNGGRAGADHVRLAAGFNSSEATPTSGTIYTPFQSETLTVHVTVKRQGAMVDEF